MVEGGDGLVVGRVLGSALHPEHDLREQGGGLVEHPQVRFGEQELFAEGDGGLDAVAHTDVGVGDGVRYGQGEAGGAPQGREGARAAEGEDVQQPGRQGARAELVLGEDRHGHPDSLQHRCQLRADVPEPGEGVLRRQDQDVQVAPAVPVRAPGRAAGHGDQVHGRTGPGEPFAQVAQVRPEVAREVQAVHRDGLERPERPGGVEGEAVQVALEAQAGPGGGVLSGGIGGGVLGCGARHGAGRGGGVLDGSVRGGGGAGPGLGVYGAQPVAEERAQLCDGGPVAYGLDAHAVEERVRGAVAVEAVGDAFGQGGGVAGVR